MFKGIVWLFQKIGLALGGIFGLLGKFKGLLPKSILGFFILITFFQNLFKYGFNIASKELAKSILAAELVIRENVMLAVQNSPQYGLYEFLEIFFSLMVLWYLLKMLARIFESFGMVGSFGRILSSLGIIIVLEVAAIAIVDVPFSFVPIKDGVWFLFMNLDPVLQNIHLFKEPIQQGAEAILYNNSGNTTNISDLY